MHLRAVPSSRIEQRQAGAHGAFGVVLAGFVGAEHREHAVAGVLQHLAPCALNDSGELRKGAVHDGVDLLRIEVLAQRGGADDVEEQDSDLL